MKLSNRLTVIHGVESSNLVDAHWWHFQPACNFVHDADAGEAVLALAEIEEGHYGSFLILGRVSFKDLGDELLVDGIELKWYGCIIDRSISMLGDEALMEERESGKRIRRTTFKVSLWTMAVEVRCRHCGLLWGFEKLAIYLKTRGSGLEAMMKKRRCADDAVVLQ